jgi:peroxidase
MKSLSARSVRSSKRRSLIAAIRQLFGGAARPEPRYRGRSLQVHPSLETLEGRSLMAVVAGLATDMADTPPAEISSAITMPAAPPRGLRQNVVDSEDVDDDGECTASDVLSVINAINAKSMDTARGFVDVDGDGECTASDVLRVINRINSGNTRRPRPGPVTPPTATGEVRSIDGTGNNVANPEWGSTNEQFLLIAPADYGDGISTPAGADRPSAREISNEIVAHSDEATPSDRNLTAYIYVWGQFLDHDLDLTGTGSPKEPFTIPVPTGDAVFDPQGTGTAIIPLSRSGYDPASGTSTENPRQQVNLVTSWIDGSMVYGSDAATAASLRTFVGGAMKTSEGNFLPTDAGGNFLAGDVRVNENVELTSLQTLFVREHNRLAGNIAAATPTLTDEQVYQKARALVIAELQAVTYNEWLPALLGKGALAPYRGYNASVNPGIANEFATAAFRLHTTINDDVEFFDNNGRPITFDYVNAVGETVTVDGGVSLVEAFFNPSLLKQSGVDGVLKYAASTHMEELDTQVVDSLRNFLFTLPGGGLDLAALNIQRGRDHGLADYNSVRAAYGLPRVTSFDQITSDPELQAKLESTYGSVDNIDMWIGGLAEDHVRGGSVGPLVQRVLADQFQRLRDGDRFWYQQVFSGPQLAELERTSLSDIIERNTGVKGLQDNVFFFQSQAGGQVFNDLNGDGVLNIRREAGLRGIEVQLLSDEGSVIATTTTNREGRYQFMAFPETGDFQIKLVVPTGANATTSDLLTLLISTGDQRRLGLNFGVSLPKSTTVVSAEGEASDWSAAVDSLFGA